MPTYRFKCSTCKANASVAVPIEKSDSIQVPKCLACQKVMEREFVAPAVTFKGNGWGKDR